MRDQDIELAENTVRKAMKDLDITHVEAIVFLTGTLKPLLNFIYHKDLIFELRDMFEKHSEINEAFAVCLFKSMNIIEKCEELLKMDE